LLLSKGYAVQGMVRRSSYENFERIDHPRERIELHHDDLLDQYSLAAPLHEIKPDEATIWPRSPLSRPAGANDAYLLLLERGKPGEA